MLKFKIKPCLLNFCIYKKINYWKLSNLFFILNIIKAQSEFEKIEDPTSEDIENLIGSDGLRICDSKGIGELEISDIEKATFDRPSISYDKTIKISGNFVAFLQDYIIATQSDNSPIYSYSEGRGTGKFEHDKGQMIYPSDWNPKSTDAIGRGFLFWGIAVKAFTESREINGKSKRVNKYFKLSTGYDDDYNHNNIGFDRRYADKLSQWLSSDLDKTLSMLHDRDVYSEFRNEIFDLMKE